MIKWLITAGIIVENPRIDSLLKLTTRFDVGILHFAGISIIPDHQCLGCVCWELVVYLG